MAGGPLTDEHAHVLDEHDRPIPSLSACGNTAASAMGHVYAGGGISLGQSSVFGLVAAEQLSTGQHGGGRPAW
jgi:3-oxosteroid 1-dehydrogenase